MLRNIITNDNDAHIDNNNINDPERKTKGSSTFSRSRYRPPYVNCNDTLEPHRICLGPLLGAPSL